MNHHDTGCHEAEEECLCPVEGVLSIVSKKWAICIVSLLGKKGRGYRFNELKRKLDGISPKVLSERLKELKSEGLINRKVEESVPPKVEYKLTKEGMELHNSIRPLVKWVKKVNK